MHRHHTFLFSLAVLGSFPAAALAGTHQILLPPDSFIDQHVASMSQMSQQVTLDPVVRRRLARHFHTSGPAVARYIQNNLVLKKTTTAQRYQVYCISRTGQEYTVNSRLPIGTPVFVMRSTGKPILKLACGNPMVAELPPIKTKIEAYTSPELASLPKTAPAAIPSTLAPNGPVLVAMNSGPGVIIMPVTQKISPFAPASLIARSGKFPIGLLAGIPIIAGIASHGGGNTPAGTTGTGTGTGTTGTGTGTTGTGGTNTGGGSTPVPEPSTPAAFAVGAAVLGYLLLARGAAAKRHSMKKAKN